MFDLENAFRTGAENSARVAGRSALAHLGLAIHMTAPTIQAGFEGRIALEMYNFGAYSLRPRTREFAVCQLIFERLVWFPAGRSKLIYRQVETHVKVRKTSAKDARSMAS
jgi:dCTP deaminase